MRPDQLRSAASSAFLAALLIPTALMAGVFGVLFGIGALRAWPALLGWLACAIIAAGFAGMLAREFAALAWLIRGLRAGFEYSDSGLKLWFPGVRAVALEAIGMIRTQGADTARLKAMAMADRTLLERLPEPLLRLDGVNTVEWRNESAVVAFGTDTASLLRHPEIRAALADARRLAVPLRRSIALAAPVPRDLDVIVIPAGGQLYLLLSDRTRERSVEKMRADFVANVSHELRTPLASLIGFIETLRGAAKDDPEAQERFLQIMAEQADRMQRVIADLLSLTRIEITEHQPPEEMLLLPPLLERTVAALEPVLRTNGAAVELSIAADLPPLPGDGDQLIQVFTNLLDNAIKYGKRGGKIALIAERAEGDPRFEAAGVLVSVRDEGPGIPRQHLTRLTERFYRADKGRSRALGGTGLGLAIVKHVVNRHRGRLLIDSAEGRGSTFLVWLPFAQR